MRSRTIPLLVTAVFCSLASGPDARCCRADVLVNAPEMWVGNPSMAGDLDNELFVAVEDLVLQWFYVFRSTNNGASWEYQMSVSGGDPGWSTAHPSLAVGRDYGGERWVYVAYQATYPDGSQGVEFLRYDPDNTSDVDVVTVQSGVWMSDLIHPEICTDSPPFIGDDSVYLVYHVRSGPDPHYEVMFSRSDDHGLHWSTPQGLASVPLETHERPDIEVGGHLGFPGDAYRVYVTYEAGVYSGGRWQNDVYVRVSRYYGDSWDPPIHLTSSGDDEYDARVAATRGGFPAMVVYTRNWQNSGDLDIRYAFSADCGVTWNTEWWLAGSGAVEQCPEVAILDDHRFDCAFWMGYDVKVAWADDANPTVWSNPVVVNDGHTAASAFPRPTLGFMREHPEETECGVAWTDERNNHYSVYFDNAGAGPSGVLDNVNGRLPEGPFTVELGAPRPNPSRGGAPLLFPVRVSRSAVIRVAVYDASGKRVCRTPDREVKGPGEHLIAWTLPDLAPGVYFARVFTDHGPTGATARVVVR